MCTPVVDWHLVLLKSVYYHVTCMTWSVWMPENSQFMTNNEILKLCPMSDSMKYSNTMPRVWLHFHLTITHDTNINSLQLAVSTVWNKFVTCNYTSKSFILIILLIAHNQPVHIDFFFKFDICHIRTDNGLMKNDLIIRTFVMWASISGVSDSDQFWSVFRYWLTYFKVTESLKGSLELGLGCT